MKGVKNLLIAAFLLWAAIPAHAKSVADFEKLTTDEKSKFMLKAVDELLAKVKAYDPALAQKTSAFFYDEKNENSYAKGSAEVFETIIVAKMERPEVLDKLQVENIIRVVFRRYWKEQDITVPNTIFDGKPASTAQKPANAG